MVELYVLRDPETNEVRYAGKANNAAARLKTHMRDSRRRNTPVYCWIRSLAARGLMPAIEVVQRTERAEWQIAEKTLIVQLRESGARLLNLADGGDEPYCSDEVRAANGRKLAQSIANDPIAKKIHSAKRILGEAWRKGRLTESTKEKMRICAAKRPDLFGLWATV